MITYENDNLIIPKKYKNMSAAQLEKEKEKTLKKLLGQKKPTFKVKSKQGSIKFNF